MAITEYGSDTTLNKLEGKNWVATMMRSIFVIICWKLHLRGLPDFIRYMDHHR